MFLGLTGMTVLALTSPMAAVYAGPSVVLVAIRLVRGPKARARTMAALGEAATAAARGDLEAAEAQCWRIAESAREPGFAALARFRLARVLIRRGQHARAAAVIADNEARFSLALQQIGLAAHSAGVHALACALAGELAEAGRWLAEQETRARDFPSNSPTWIDPLARAIVACREGRSVEALDMLERDRIAFQLALPGEELRALRVVRAFAQVGDVRDAARATTTLGDLRPLYPDELAFLGVQWPEMARFLASHGLDRFEPSSATSRR